MPRPSSFGSRAPEPERGRRKPSLWRHAWNLTSESLREHPTFNFEDESEVAGEAGVIKAAELSEATREPLYEAQWLRIFVARLLLSGFIGIFSLSLLIGFYFLIFPGLSRKILVVDATVTGALLVQSALLVRVRALWQVRALSMIAFLVFSGGTAWALSLVSADGSPAEIESARAVQFVITAAFAHILLISLVLPLRLSDTLWVGVIVLGALSLGLRSVPVTMQTVSSVGAVWVIGTVAIFVALLSYFNSRLRRRVFDSAFDLALQAVSMKAISETDSLTGGFNRRHCERILGLELARAARFAHPLSLLMFDLDNFKPVNDTLGHAAGDRVLVEIHRAATNELREVDDLSRLGGDEFLILLPETDARQAARAARRLHARVSRELETRFGKGSLLGKVTISVGTLTLEAGHPLSANQALQSVDELLYNAKNQGKNRVVSGVVNAGVEH